MGINQISQVVVCHAQKIRGGIMLRFFLADNVIQFAFFKDDWLHKGDN